MPSNSTVSGNTVVSFSVGIWAGNANTINSDEVSLASGALIISGRGNVVKDNVLFTTIGGGAGISFNCTGTNNIVTHNLINQSFWGIINLHSTNVITPNTFSNVTKRSPGRARGFTQFRCGRQSKTTSQLTQLESGVLYVTTRARLIQEW